MASISQIFDKFIISSTLPKPPLKIIGIFVLKILLSFGMDNYYMCFRNDFENVVTIVSDDCHVLYINRKNKRFYIPWWAYGSRRYHDAYRYRCDDPYAWRPCSCEHGNESGWPVFEVFLFVDLLNWYQILIEFTLFNLEENIVVQGGGKNWTKNRKKIPEACG